MSEPKVSVVISVYNEEKVLEECLDALVNQSYVNLEIICIDDGSEDGSRQILKSYDQEYEEFELYLNDENLGLTKSLNKGIEKAEGDYIARQDADDVSVKDRIEEQVRFMEENPDIFLTGQHSDTTSYRDEKGNLLRPYRPEEKQELDLQEGVPIDHSSIMFRNDGIKYREKFTYSQDYDLYLRINTDRGRIELLEEELVYRKIQPDSISSRSNKQQAYFRQKAREFWQERKQKGEDSYGSWEPNPPEQETTEGSKQEHYLRNKMEYSLESGNKKQAQQFYQQFKSLEEVSKIDEIQWKIAVNSLTVFKVYRKFFV